MLFPGLKDVLKPLFCFVFQRNHLSRLEAGELAARRHRLRQTRRLRICKEIDGESVCLFVSFFLFLSLFYLSVCVFCGWFVYPLSVLNYFSQPSVFVRFTVFYLQLTLLSVFQCLSLCLPVSLFLCLSVSLSLSFSLYPFYFVSDEKPVWLSVFLSLFHTVFQFRSPRHTLCLSFCLSNRPIVHYFYILGETQDLSVFLSVVSLSL